MPAGGEVGDAVGVGVGLAGDGDGDGRGVRGGRVGGAEVAGCLVTVGTGAGEWAGGGGLGGVDDPAVTGAGRTQM